MFGRAYFGSSYYGPSYWAKGTTVSVPTGDTHDGADKKRKREKELIPEVVEEVLFNPVLAKRPVFTRQTVEEIASEIREALDDEDEETFLIL